MGDRMKEAMSGIDLRAIASELQSLVGSHCKKSYQPHYEQIVLRLRAKGGGNTDLVLVRGNPRPSKKNNRFTPIES